MGKIVQHPDLFFQHLLYTCSATEKLNEIVCKYLRSKIFSKMQICFCKGIKDIEIFELACTMPPH